MNSATQRSAMESSNTTPVSAKVTFKFPFVLKPQSNGGYKPDVLAEPATIVRGEEDPVSFFDEDFGFNSQKISDAERDAVRKFVDGVDTLSERLSKSNARGLVQEFRDLQCRLGETDESKSADEDVLTGEEQEDGKEATAQFWRFFRHWTTNPDGTLTPEEFANQQKAQLEEKLKAHRALTRKAVGRLLRDIASQTVSESGLALAIEIDDHPAKRS